MHTKLPLITGLVDVLRQTLAAHSFAHRTALPSTPSITSSIRAGVLLQEPQCRVLSSALSRCAIRTPGFNTMEPTKQASCLCYEGINAWAPSVFDAAAKACASHASTVASRDVYDPLHLIESFCVEIGNVQMRTTAAPTNSNLPWCNSVREYMKSCSDTTSGFMDLEKKVQASCLCYVTVDTITSWLPHQFDDAVEGCGVVASNYGKTEVYDAITSLNSFCAGIGDRSIPPSLHANTPASSLTAHGSSTITDSMTSTKTSNTAVPYPVPLVPPPKETVPPIPGINESEGRGMGTKMTIIIGAVCAFLVLFFISAWTLASALVKNYRRLS